MVEETAGVFTHEARSENGYWKMAFFGLKLGLDLEMQAVHPHQKFQPPPPLL